MRVHRGRRRSSEGVRCLIIVRCCYVATNLRPDQLIILSSILPIRLFGRDGTVTTLAVIGMLPSPAGPRTRSGLVSTNGILRGDPASSRGITAQADTTCISGGRANSHRKHPGGASSRHCGVPSDRTRRSTVACENGQKPYGQRLNLLVTVVFIETIKHRRKRPESDAQGCSAFFQGYGAIIAPACR